MSLLITSNSPARDNFNSGDAQQGLNKSYSYQNNLQDTFKIPKNSEIAVQSVKLNRSGNITLDSGNSVYAFYFGEELGTFNANNEEIDQSMTTSTPWQKSIVETEVFTGEDEEFGNDAAVTSVNITDNVNGIARRFQANLNRNLWHPMLLQNASTTINPGAKVTPQRNGSGLDWLGWNIQVSNNGSSTNASNISASWLGNGYNGDGEGADYSYDPKSGALTAPANNFSPCVGTQFPLSLANGSFSIELLKKSGIYQRYGLTRATNGSRAGDFNGVPSYFDDEEGGNFYDYSVEIENNGAIKVYYAGAVDTDTGELSMINLNYGATKNASTLNIKYIRFVIKNEQVSIIIENASGVATVLTDGTSATSASNLKPVNMVTRFLYPKVDLEAGETCLINEFFGVNIANHQYANGGLYDEDGDFEENQPNYAFHDFYNYLLDWAGVSGNLYAQVLDCEREKQVDKRFLVGLNTNGQCDYKITFLTAPDSRYENTNRCNTQFLLGFPNRSLVNVANTTSATTPFTKTFISDSAPEIQGTQSLFVRLKNMTFESVNLAKSAKSKILYHLPAFSGNGTRVGALFFEPSERVYLKLNNTEDLYLSTIEIDIVYSDETLAECLQGKTTVCLHIQEAHH